MLPSLLITPHIIKQSVAHHLFSFMAEILTHLWTSVSILLVKRIQTTIMTTFQNCIIECPSYVAARQNMVNSYHQNRKYYDRKCAATPLELHSYCLILDTKVTNPNTSFEKQRSKWLPLYRVEKVLTHSNYIVRKVATNHTSLVHGRLRPIKRQYGVNDLEEIDESKFEADPNTEEYEKEPQLLDSYSETSLELNTESEHRQVQFEDSVKKNQTEGEIGDTWLSKLNENSSSSGEFTVGQNSTNDQMLTSESIDTENYNFRQKSAEPETTQPKYILRTGDRMIAVREQCAAHLRSLRKSAFDRHTGCIKDSGTHIAYWISLDMEPNSKTAKYVFQKHPILKWQSSRQNSCVGQTSLYFDESENRWIISLICSKNQLNHTSHKISGHAWNISSFKCSNLDYMKEQ